jgi:subtilase family serine protease
VTFAQSFDGIPVFGGIVTMHIGPDGEVVRVTSSAARGTDRRVTAGLPADQAAMLAAADVSPEVPFVPARVAGPAGSSAIKFARGRFRSDVSASLVWFPIDGGLRLAWHVEVEPDGEAQYYDLLIDAQTGELLLRRNRVLDGQGSGRVIQSAATQALDPRRPDQAPDGAGGCPPPTNHELRDLTAPFRDPGTVLFDTGFLSGNNAHVFRRNVDTEGALGMFDGTRWVFDFPFNSAQSAETALFFGLNFAHDFFYDLGFDEASGNFQVDNFGRGGVGGDPIKGLARAPGRNNATFQPQPEGTSPIISMFLFDGMGCWSQDVDADGVQDIDGDYDADVLLHEFHHGVSHRLNTNFHGNEADAIGEGGSDFFAYSINGDTTLAEYSLPGGIRAVNGKTYADWFCIFGLFCEPHDNGEIWVNALWDVRERFRTDLVRGSESAAINESHQLYIDGLKLSPPLPTMLDMRDAMLEADELRNPGSPQSANYCRLWESFAARGMGVNATDTSDNGFNQVGADFSVPPGSGCNAPPAPPMVSVSVAAASATEVGPAAGVFTLSRAAAEESSLTVSFTLTGTAINGTDYQPAATTATIPPGATSVDVPITPIDDTIVEVNESVVMTLKSDPSYSIGAPSTGVITIVSDDVAPDLTVPSLTVPQIGGAGLTISVTDTTRNQGTGTSEVTTTSFYLSANALLDAADRLIGTREVPSLTTGTNSVQSTTLTIPSDVATGSYTLIAKADGPGAFVETNENNNTRGAIIKIGPDLVVSALTAPGSTGAGLTISVSDTTKNQGGGPSDGSSTRFYLSVNSAIDATDRSLEARTVGPLAPGATSAGVTNVTIPTDMVAGTYYLIARADDTAGVVESADTNNTRYALVRVGADLQVTGLTGPGRAASGAQISVTDTTKNVGGGAADGSTTAFFLSTNLSLDASDQRLTTTTPRTVGPLNPGVGSTATTTVMLPAVAAGTWYLLANADDGHAVPETLETNNVRYTTIYIGPDLTVSLFTGPATATAGGTVTVTETVKNLGAETAAPSTTRYYLSVNAALDASDTPLEATRDVPSLIPNTVSTGSTTLTLPAGVSGKYYLLAVADGNAVIVESSEVNNVGAKVISINP